ARREFDGDSILFGKFIHIRTQGRRKTQVVQNGRVELVRYAPYIIGYTAHPSAQRPELLARLVGVGGQVFFQAIDCDFQHSHILVESVVELARNLPALLLVCGDEANLVPRPLDVIDVHQNQDRTLDFIFLGPVRTYAEHIPAAVKVLHLSLVSTERFNYFGQLLLQVRNVHIGTDIADGAPGVGGNDPHHFFRLRRELPDAEIAADHHDRQVHVAEKIAQVIIGLRKLAVAILQFFVNGVQLFVAGLQFLLGGLELFVRTLQLLVAGLNLFIGRPEFFVCRLLLLDDGLQSLFGNTQFLPQQAAFLAFRTG